MSDDGRENNVLPPSTETEEGPKGPPDISGLYSLKLDNLDYSVTLEQLKELFGKHGEIGDVYMPRDYYTKRSRGFAFVRFKDRTAAEVRTRSFVSSADPPRGPSPPEPFFCIRRRSQKQNPDSSVLIRSDRQEAIKEFDQKELNGRPIACRFAEKPRPDNPREPYQGGGRGGRGGDSHRGGGGSYGGSYSSRRPYGGGDDYGPSRGAYREVYDRRGPYDRRDSDRSRGRDDYHYDKDRGYSNRGGYDDRSRGYDRRDGRPRSR